MTQGGQEACARNPSRLVAVTVSLFGVRVRASVRADLLGAFRASFPPQLRFVPGPLQGAAWRVAAESDLAGAVAGIEAQIARQAPELIFVHAGAVEVDGRALLLPGRSRAGKSTLVAELVRAGAQYLSDEFAPIDRDGRVVPFARPIRLRAGATAAFPAGADGSGPAGSGPDVSRPALSGPGPLSADRFEVALVAGLRYDRAGPAAWLPEQPSRTLLTLIDNTVPAQERASQMLVHLAAAVRSARGISGTRGEAAPAAALLLAELGRTGQ